MKMQKIIKYNKRRRVLKIATKALKKID